MNQTATQTPTRASETPRCDAIEYPPGWREISKLARTLERELADATQARARLHAYSGELETKTARLRGALEAAYLALLSIPHNNLIRVTTDKARAACRDAIAAATERDNEAVQNDFEARSALVQS